MKNYQFPLIAIMIATVTAFAAEKRGRTVKSAEIQGYIFNHSTNQWDRSVMCNNEGGPICTVNGLPSGQQVFGTSGPEVDHPETANVELYKNQ